MDDRSDSADRDDGAVFAPARVRGSRGSRILVGVAVVLVGALVAIGVLDRQPESADVAVLPASDAPAPPATIRPETARSSRPPPRASIGVPGSGTGSPTAQVFDFDVRPAGSHLFIHGDVFSLTVTRVRVRIEDSAGHVAATRAVDVPGGSRAFLIGAVPRFDVHFFLPDELQADGFVVSATALDAKGHRIVTLEQRVPRAAESM
jgi:hypothetical protein